MFLVGSIMLTALLNCIDIFVLSFGFVDLSNVHGLSSSHMCRHTISKFFIMERSVEESLEHILGKHGSHCSCFYAVSYHL